VERVSWLAFQHQKYSPWFHLPQLGAAHFVAETWLFQYHPASPVPHCQKVHPYIIELQQGWMVCEGGRVMDQGPTLKTWDDVVWPTVQKRISPLSSQEQRTSVNLGWKSSDVTWELCPLKVCKAPLSYKWRNSHELRISLQLFTLSDVDPIMLWSKYKSIRTKQ
jgi:hypothetical protein